MLPLYNTKTFSQIFPNYDSFKNMFDNDFDKVFKDVIPAANLKVLYWLLFSRYADNPVVNYSEMNFKAKLCAIVFAKGPAWVRKLAIQDSLRNLSEDDLLTGARTIFNRAQHDETEPGTNTDEELTFLNSQDVSKQRRSKLDAYSYLQDILKWDTTEEFLAAFAKLFSKFVSPEITRVYENDIEEDI